MTMAEVRRILVVDDDPDIVELLVLNLEAGGYTVETANDGQQALDVAKQMLPDLIVLDVMMPRKDGLEALAELKMHPTTTDIPVVMLTAKATDSDVWTGWQAGADYYLTKPFDVDELMRFISYLQVTAAS
jgi:DNA-binding response OmpR family regulator